MAVDLLAELDRYRAAGGHDLHVRVGAASGPTVAGVIGLRKFIYDVWGDTVNLASRLESTGVADRIQVTAELGRRLAGTFLIEPRGMIELKGRGAIETCFVVGRLEGGSA
jgi:adenylate cyclase